MRNLTPGTGLGGPLDKGLETYLVERMDKVRRAWWSFLVVSFLGCAPSPLGIHDAGWEWVDAGGMDAGASDAGAADAGTADAGCQSGAGCPCFSNHDCPADEKCKSFDPSGSTVVCVPGTRGAGAPGDGCSGEDDCASALCVERTGMGMYCSGLCSTAIDCPAILPRCLFIGFGVDQSMCAPPAP